MEHICDGDLSLRVEFGDPTCEPMVQVLEALLSLLHRQRDILAAVLPRCKVEDLILLPVDQFAKANADVLLHDGELATALSSHLLEERLDGFLDQVTLEVRPRDRR